MIQVIAKELKFRNTKKFVLIAIRIGEDQIRQFEI